MILKNVQIVPDNDAADIAISNDNITSIQNHLNSSNEYNDPLQLTFTNAIAFPGLINSHDHLDFNLFPQLGNKIYTNYTQWGKWIHQHYQEQIQQVLQVPKTLRTQWGIYKNMLCGVTAVVNHGPKLSVKSAPIRVYQRSQSIHSVQFDKYWKLKLNIPLPKRYCTIHVGEGTDALASDEIDQLIRWNKARRKLVGIHGVAMKPHQATHFENLVWCPASNYFMFHSTADIARLKNYTTTLFGTDSTLTADWNIWEHMRLARKAAMLNDYELFNCVTYQAATAWNMNSGSIKAGRQADIVIAKKKSDNSLHSFYQVDPQDILLVVHNGCVRLFDATIASLFPKNFQNTFGLIKINQSLKYVPMELINVAADIKNIYPNAQLPFESVGHATC